MLKNIEIQRWTAPELASILFAYFFLHLKLAKDVYKPYTQSVRVHTQIAKLCDKGFLYRKLSLQVALNLSTCDLIGQFTYILINKIDDSCTIRHLTTETEQEKKMRVSSRRKPWAYILSTRRPY
jgi:hypothetical protein